MEIVGKCPLCPADVTQDQLETEEAIFAEQAGSYVHKKCIHAQVPVHNKLTLA